MSILNKVFNNSKSDITLYQALYGYNSQLNFNMKIVNDGKSHVSCK